MNDFSPHSTVPEPGSARWSLWCASMPGSSTAMEDMVISVHQVVGRNTEGQPLVAGPDQTIVPARDLMSAGAVSVLCSPSSEVPTMEQLYAMLANSKRHTNESKEER